MNLKIPEMNQTREANFRSESINAEERTVELTWATDTPVLRTDVSGKRYREVLSFEPDAIRMERFSAGKVNLLDSHQSAQGVKAILALMEQPTIDSNSKFARGIARFSRRSEVEPIFQDVKDGIIKGASVGYRIHGTKEITQKGDKIPTLLITDWEPFEVSLVSVPADMRSGTRSEEFNNAEEKNEMLKEPSKEPDPAERGINLEAGIQAERTRTLEITKAVRAAKLGDSLADELISSGISIDQARARIIDEFVKAGSSVETRSQIKVGELEETETRRTAMTHSILNRIDPAKYKVEGATREYAGSSLLDLARESLNETGTRTRGLYPMDIAERALSTSDFQNILMNVANKTLREAYQSVPQTFRPFCSQCNGLRSLP